MSAKANPAPIMCRDAPPPDSPELDACTGYFPIDSGESITGCAELASVFGEQPSSKSPGPTEHWTIAPLLRVSLLSSLLSSFRVPLNSVNLNTDMFNRAISSMGFGWWGFRVAVAFAQIEVHGVVV